jgi:alanine racemase
MVKANAYGHGMGWVANTLAKQPDLEGFGVATLEEGIQLRKDLTLRNRQVKILIASGASAWSDAKGESCRDSQLTPALTSEEDFEKFIRSGWHQKLTYELKFNTGMNRLGIHYSALSKIKAMLLKLPENERPQGILSHLASAESPEKQETQAQFERFKKIKQELDPVLPRARFSIANSGAIWNQQHYGLSEFTDFVRPGISLYGIPPWKGAPLKGLLPVMTVQAKIIHKQQLKAGDSVGYGGLYRAPEPVTVATVAIGYADGLHRRFRGQGMLNGQSVSWVGRISMDLSAIVCPASTKVGSWVELLGSLCDPWRQAEANETIPYELLTSFGNQCSALRGLRCEV